MVVVGGRAHEAIAKGLWPTESNELDIKVDKKAFVFQKVIQRSISLPFKVDVYSSKLEEQLISH